jgi:hypothetical protein
LGKTLPSFFVDRGTGSISARIYGSAFHAMSSPDLQQANDRFVSVMICQSVISVMDSADSIELRAKFQMAAAFQCFKRVRARARGIPG